LNKIKGMTLAVAVIGLLSMGTWGLLHRGDAAPPQRPLDKAAPPKAKADEADEGPKGRDYILVPARRDGVIAFIGRPLKKDEKVAGRDLRTVTVGGVPMKLVRLREGDRVEHGQLLGRIEDVLARK